MEVVRDTRRQRHHHLRHRKRGPDGGAYRRLDHRGPGPDADGQGISADADGQIAVLREIGVETGGSNVQWAVNPADGRMVVIEMNPRVSALIGAGLQGDRLSDCQNRCETGGWLYAGRVGQRHHQGHPGAVLSRRLTMSSPKSRALRLRNFPARNRCCPPR